MKTWSGRKIWLVFFVDLLLLLFLVLQTDRRSHNTDLCRGLGRLLGARRDDCCCACARFCLTRGGWLTLVERERERKRRWPPRATESSGSSVEDARRRSATREPRGVPVAATMTTTESDRERATNIRRALALGTAPSISGVLNPYELSFGYYPLI